MRTMLMVLVVAGCSAGVPGDCALPYAFGDGGESTSVWVYSATAQACLPRAFSGSGGNSNRFESAAACTAMCGPRALSCASGRSAQTVCIQGGAAGGCALTATACARPCSSPGDCAGDAIGFVCSGGFCNATSAE